MKTPSNRPPAPPSRKSHLVTQAPAPTFTPDNLSKPTEDLVFLNFRVAEEFHREFKTTAAVRGMSMKDLLAASFEAWKEKFGSDGK